MDVFRCGQLVIERDNHSPAIENGERRNQPFRLVGHDNGGAATGPKFDVFQGTGQRQSHLFKVGVSEPGFLLVPVGFDQADFVGPALQRVAQSRPQTGVLVKIQHEEVASLLLILDGAIKNWTEFVSVSHRNQQPKVAAAPAHSAKSSSIFAVKGSEPPGSQRAAR